MKKPVAFGLSCALSVACGLGTGCNWDSGSGGNDFNTSRGAGVNVNWSGVYNGLLSGGRAVGAASGNIQRLVLTQAGNSVSVIDSLGNRYSGNIGSPGAIASSSGGVFPAGAELATSQVNFEGNGVQFVGVLHAVSVVEISGDATEVTTTDESSQSNVQGTGGTRGGVETVVLGDTTVVTTTSIQGGNPLIQQTVVSTYNNQTGALLSRTVTTEDITGTDADRQATVNRVNSFTLTEQNTQFRLEGNWIDPAGSFPVDALSRGNASTITETTTQDVTVEPVDVQVDLGQVDQATIDTGN